MRIDPKVEGPTRRILEHVIRDDLDEIPRTAGQLGDDRFRECVGLCVIISGYVTLDVLGPEWPTDEGLRELAKRVARAKIDVDLDESKIHGFLRTSAIGFQSLDRVFTDRQEMTILPILIAASLLLAFHPRDQEIWEYLNDIEEALEAADSVKPSVYPAMILAAHRHEASKAR